MKYEYKYPILYPDFQYVDTAFGGVYKRNNVKKINDIILPSNPIDCFITYCRYPKEYLLHWSNTINDHGMNAVKGYSGLMVSDFLPIDIDCEGDLDKSLITGRNFNLFRCTFDK